MKLLTLDNEFIEETEVFPVNTNFTGIVEYAPKSRQYYKNGMRHRDNGLPAVEYADGSCLWYVDGKRHRNDVDGPAADYKNGPKYYFMNDEMIFKWKSLGDYEKIMPKSNKED
jgi:hypothetical protein